MVTFARDMTGLEDNQILALNHALMREGAAVGCSHDDWLQMIADVRADYGTRRLYTTPGSRDPLPRLEAAEGETGDGRRLYAARNLVERSRRMRDAQDEYMRNYARDTGITEAQARSRFNDAFMRATQDSSLHPSPAFRHQFRDSADNAHLLLDRRSLYAYEQLQIERASRLAQDSRPAVTREPRRNSTVIAEMGYSPLTHRAEVVMRSNPDRVYVYQMTPDEYEEFSRARSVGSYYARYIRGNSRYQFGSVELQDASAVVHRCPTCGQFAGLNHSCPVTGSPEAVNRDTRVAVARARHQSVASEPMRLAFMRTGRYYLGDSTGHGRYYVRVPSLSSVGVHARSNTEVLVPLRAALDGQPQAEIVGFARVHYNGRGRGFQVTAVTEPGDSGADNLRCTCAAYRATYHCEHVDGLIHRMQAALNGDETAEALRVTPVAMARVEQSLERLAQMSVQEMGRANRRFQPLTGSFEEDPQAFQRVYDEARAQIRAYRQVSDNPDAAYPVPMIMENALGGLSPQGSPRSFGIEIEFELPRELGYQEQARIRREIGRELYDAGLLRTADRQGYGASHGAYRPEHARGWSYEDDCTVTSGGEIVSPVMWDTPETWQNITKICEVLKRHGAVATERAGMHVHVGVGDYDHNIGNHNRLLAAFKEHEDLVYRLATNPQAQNHRNLQYCRPNSTPGAAYTSLDRLQYGQAGHSVGLNFQSVDGSRRSHVEFRAADATLIPSVMQAQIATAVYMTEGALRDGTEVPRQQETRLIGSALGQNPRRRNLTGDQWKQSTLQFRRFLDRFVPGDGGDDTQNPRVKQMVSLFAATRWQQRGGW